MLLNRFELVGQLNNFKLADLVLGSVLVLEGEDMDYRKAVQVLKQFDRILMFRARTWGGHVLPAVTC